MLNEYQKAEACREGLTSRRTPIEALTAFLDSLKESEMPLPMHGSHPNIRQIAKLCGIKRDWFYVSPELQQMLGQFNLSEEKLN